MKILFYNPVAAVGGGELSLLDLIASFRQHTPPPEMVLLLTESGPLVDEATALGINVGILPLPKSLSQLGDSYGNHFQTLTRLIAAGPQFASYIRDFKRFVNAAQPTVIHTNGIKSHLIASLAMGKTCPVVWHVRDFLGERTLMSRIVPHFRRRLSGVIAISDAVRRDLKMLLPETSIERIYDGIDTQRFADSTRPTIQPLSQPSGQSSRQSFGPLKVGLIATYARWKGHQLFIEAAAAAIKKMDSKCAPEFRPEFWIVGGPIYKTGHSQWTRNELEALVDKCGVKKHFKFVDFEPRIEKIFHSLDIVVHASTRPEPFGRTIAEGMASRRAVIAADGGGASELIEDSVTGLLFPPKSVSKLSDAIVRLLNDAPLRENLANAAEKAAREKFARNRLAAECLVAYQNFGITVT